MLDGLWEKLTGARPPGSARRAEPALGPDDGPLFHDVDRPEERVRELVDLADIEASLVLVDGKYVVGGDDGVVSDGPFCTTCFDARRALVRLRWTEGGPAGAMRCPECGRESPG